MTAPKWSEDAPEIPFGSEWIYGAFWDLHTCRPYGWGAGPIPWTAMRDYYTAFEMDTDEFEDFAHLIRAMDNAFLAYDREQSTKK